MPGILSGEPLYGVLSGQAVPEQQSYAQKLPGALSSIYNNALIQGLRNAPGTAAGDLEQKNWWRGSVMGTPPDVQQRIMQRALSAALIGMPTVWHGSPYKFDRFDPSKIGSGQGAATFGVGHYVAENPKVAKDYREMLSGKYEVSGAPQLPREASGHKAMDFKSDLEQYMGISKYSPDSDMLPFLRQRMADRASRWEQSGEGKQGGSAPEDMNRLVDWYKAHIEKVSPEKVSEAGSTYKIDLPDAAAAKMLDWDKPLSEQSESVRQALTTAFRNRGFPLAGGTNIPAVMLNEKTTGESLHAYLAASLQGKGGNSAGQAAAAATLKELGIPGIRYLDQGSRVAGKGTSNYVVFPGGEDLLKIIGRE